MEKEVIKVKNKSLLFLILAIVIGIGGFFAGMKYPQSKNQSIRGQFRSGERPQGMGGSQGQGRPISGEIIDSDEKSVTVKLPDGSSRIIFVGDSTEINKSAPGTKDDLTKGTQVFVIGSENPEGSITANSIQIGRLRGQ